MVSVTALVLGVPLIYASLRMIAAEEFDSAAVGVWFLTQVCTLASGVVGLITPTELLTLEAVEILFLFFGLLPGDERERRNFKKRGPSAWSDYPNETYVTRLENF